MLTSPPVPNLPRKEITRILNVVFQYYQECLMQWKIKLSTLRLSGEEKRTVHALFQFMMDHMDGLASDPSDYANRFQHLVSSFGENIRPEHILLVISAFEGFVVELLLRNQEKFNVQLAYHWIHSFLTNLSASTLKSLHPSSDSNHPPESHPDNFARRRDLIRLHEAIIQFDDKLLTLNSLEEILSYCVEGICQIAGFERGSLFWYSPVTLSIEGIYSYNVDLDDIRRIRETEYNVPGAARVLKENKPVFFEDVKFYFPEHHIRHFRLTSLLVAPLGGKDASSPVTGFLVLDQNGRPFRPSHATINLVDSLLTRAPKFLHSRLNASDSPAHCGSSLLLTRREQQILQMIADGRSTKDIASLLHISEHTAAEYVNTVLKKLKAKNRSEAVAIALRKKWIR